MIEKVPYLYYKTRTAFLDDDQCFLESIEGFFREKRHVFVSTDHMEILDIISKNSIKKDFCSTINPKENTSFDETVIAIDLFKFSKKMYESVLSKNPFGCAFVDYSMPAVNGVEVSKKLKDVVRTCLLTGEMDETQAICAFNQAVINGYIKKQDQNILKKIDEMIVDFNRELLREMNDSINGFFVHNTSIKNIYNNKEFLNYFNSITQEKNIVFSCVYEIFGSLIMASADKLYVLNLYPMEEIEGIILPLLDLDDRSRRNIVEGKEIVDYKKWEDNNVLMREDIEKNLTSDFQSFIGLYPFFSVLKEI